MGTQLIGLFIHKIPINFSLVKIPSKICNPVQFFANIDLHIHAIQLYTNLDKQEKFGVLKLKKNYDSRYALKTPRFLCYFFHEKNEVATPGPQTKVTCSV